MKQFTFIEDLARAKLATPYANDLKGRALGQIEGVVVSIDDPLNQGRVKVRLDTQVETDWCLVSNSVVGKQTRDLIGKRVLLSPISGNLHQLRVSSLLESGAALSTKVPKYNGEVPSCGPENLGSMLVQIPDDPTIPPRLLCCMPNGWHAVQTKVLSPQP